MASNHGIEMQYRSLGASGMNISIVSFGAWQLGDPKYWGEHDATESEAAVNFALDAGVNFFDTAEMYGGGQSETVLGRILGKRRKEVYVASKFWPDHAEPDAVRTACEASLTRLGTDYLDLYQVHWANRTVPFEDTFAAMKQLQDEGKVRHIGVSNFGVLDIESWMQIGSGVSNQLGYNLLFRAIEDTILPACRRHGLGVLVYMPLMQGLLSGRYKNVNEIPVVRRRTRHFSSAREGTRHGEAGAEALTFETIAQIRAIAEEANVTMAELALAWALSRQGVTSAIVGARNREQLERNLSAVNLSLAGDVFNALDTATRDLKEALGDNADMWDNATNSRVQ